MNYNFLTSSNSAAQSWVSECPDVKNYQWQLNPVWHMMRCTDSLWQQWALKGLNYWQGVMVYCLYPRHEQKTWADRSFQTSSQTSPQVPSIACTSTRPRPGTATSNGRIRWRRTWHVPTPHSIHQSCLGIKTRFCGIGHRRLDWPEIQGLNLAGPLNSVDSSELYFNIHVPHQRRPEWTPASSAPVERVFSRSSLLIKPAPCSNEWHFAQSNDLPQCNVPLLSSELDMIKLFPALAVVKPLSRMG